MLSYDEVTSFIIAYYKSLEKFKRLKQNLFTPWLLSFNEIFLSILIPLLTEVFFPTCLQQRALMAGMLLHKSLV